MATLGDLVSGLLPDFECPTQVYSRLRAIVQEQLDKLRAIKKMSLSYSKAYEQSSSGLDLLDILNSLLSKIPNPPSLNFGTIQQFKDCPFFSLAVGSDLPSFEKLDPQFQLDKIKGMLRDDVAKFQDKFDVDLQASPHGGMLKALDRYSKELVRVKFDPVGFANATVIVAAMFVLDQTEYKAGPYAAFASESKGFSYTDGVPSMLGPNLGGVVGKLAEVNGKFSAMTNAML